MLFLIQYDRSSGQTTSINRYADSEYPKAVVARLEMELTANRNASDVEIVLLEAASEAALRSTHRRYFENLADLSTQPKSA